MEAGVKLRLTDVKPGDILITDRGFTCMDKGQHLTVRLSRHGLWIPCRVGRHYLDGQEDEDGFLVGLTKHED